MNEFLVVTSGRYSRSDFVSLTRLLAFLDQLCRRTLVEFQDFQLICLLKFPQAQLLRFSLVDIDYHCTEKGFEAPAYLW